ncbi:MAG TPA: hypothetical protein VNQ99_17785 [Xanthobacteraceae bacterium]|nr:hypothetical protein [Xanthobacteraceae bacterium]
MTIFLFALSESTPSAVLQRVKDELSQRFPEHEFSPQTLAHPSLENSILAISGTVNADTNKLVIDTPAANADEVREAFQDLITESHGWRLS